MNGPVLGTEQEEIPMMVGQSGEGNVHRFGHLVCWFLDLNVDFRSNETIAILTVGLRNDQ